MIRFSRSTSGLRVPQRASLRCSANEVHLETLSFSILECEWGEISDQLFKRVEKSWNPLDGILFNLFISARGTRSRRRGKKKVDRFEGKILGKRRRETAKIGAASFRVEITSVDLGDGPGADGRPQVDVPGDGGGADVKPIGVVGGQLLGDAGLDDVHPFRGLHLVRVLEVGRQSVHELLLIDVLDFHHLEAGNVTRSGNDSPASTVS